MNWNKSYMLLYKVIHAIALWQQKQALCYPFDSLAERSSHPIK
jgi:hypothetical protein